MNIKVYKGDSWLQSLMQHHYQPVLSLDSLPTNSQTGKNMEVMYK